MRRFPKQIINFSDTEIDERHLITLKYSISGAPQEVKDVYRDYVDPASDGIMFIMSNLPEEVSVDIGAVYGDKLDILKRIPIIGGIVSAITDYQKVVGGPLLQAGLMPSWEKTEPLSFTIPMNFLAYSDPIEDVVIPCKILLSILSPHGTRVDLKQTLQEFKENADAIGSLIASGTEWGLDKLRLRHGQILYPPIAPSQQVSINVGNLISMPNAILEKVTVNYSTYLSKEGYPMSATATLSVKAPMTSLKEDILGLNPSSALSTVPGYSEE